MEFTGPISRERYMDIYLVFVLEYSIYGVIVTTCLSVMFGYLRVSIIYFAPFIGIALKMLFMAVGAAGIKQKVNIGVYSKRICCGFYPTVRNNIIHAILTMLCSMAAIAFLIAFFIQYSRGRELNEKVNEEVLGGVSMFLASCIFLTAMSTLYVSVKLRKEILSSESEHGQENFDGLVDVV